MVNGQPLRFFHFSGFDPADRPRCPSTRRGSAPDAARPGGAVRGVRGRAVGARASTEEAPALDVRAARRRDAADAALRRLYGEGEREGAFRLSPFTEAGTPSSSTGVRNRPDRGAATADPAGAGVYDARADLKRRSRLDGERRAALLLVDLSPSTGRRRSGLPPHWLPGAGRRGPGERRGPSEEPWGVNVAGYLRSELGVGEAARAVITGLDARGVPLMPVQGAYVPSSRQGHAFAFLDTDAAPFPVNLICVNADQLPAFLTRRRTAVLAGRYTIGFWWWEVTAFPERSLGALDLVDEVWVGSEHVADALRPVSKVADRQGPDPGDDAADRPYSREQLGLPDGIPVLLHVRFPQRDRAQEPDGVIDAFKRRSRPAAERRS